MEGTEIGAPEGIDAGWSLSFIDLVDLFTFHRITITDLDFTNLSNITLTFAERSTRGITIGDHTEIAYKIGPNGDWVVFQTLDPVTSEWTLQTISFGSLLDNASHVSIRITHHAFFHVGSVVSYDNISILAVPEPGTWALLAAAGVFGTLLIFRKTFGRAKAGGAPF